MTRDEMMELQPNEAADALNAIVAEGKDKAGSMEAAGLSAEDCRVLNVFWVKDKWMGRAWGGYTSVKRSGNELGDSANGVGGSDPSKGYAGV